jgi:glycosyltransferase involved in cell wall biosynthesis
MIDLIIPAYNAEDTIGRALGSIMGQTKSRKFLVTVVDDGSTDCTAAIVNKFKGLLPLQYIKLEKNLGKPGLVRNEGIKRTSCPYIMFLDSDDILAPLAGEVLSRAVTQNTPDIIIGAFLGEEEKPSEKDQYKFFGEGSVTWLHGNVYKREFLEQNQIVFDDRLNEDGSFNLKCLNLTNNIKYIKEPVAYWLNNSKSLTRSDDNFMLKISKDYIETYTDAIEFILNKAPNRVKEKDFKHICAYKFGEFCEFIEANFYNNKETEELLTLLKRYITIINSYEIIDKDFIKLSNERYNMSCVFVGIIKTHNILFYFDYIGINYKGVFK